MTLMEKVTHEITIHNTKQQMERETYYSVSGETTQRQEQSPTKYKAKLRLPKYGSQSETTRIT